MNHVYRLIWREAAGGFIAVAEMARACGGRTSSKVAAVSCALLCVAGAQAAGTGFNAVEGSATVATSGTTTTVNQTSHGVRIEWQTLGVAAGETLKFLQPSASAVALNVVKGSLPTEILGQLQANGNVFILNPNGVLVGAGAQVSVGGFLASTNDLDAFNATTGGVVLKANASTAEVRNEGTIVATPGGMVALVGNKVVNAGTILAPGGGIYLLGGGRVEFKPGDGSPFTYSLTTDSANAKSVVNTATGMLRANGGQIVMDARSTKQAVVNVEGVVEAGGIDAGPDGSIRLTALGGASEITIKQSKGKLTAGATGTITAQLDANGVFTKTLGDPNSSGSASSDPDGWLSADDKTYDGTTAATVSIDVNKLGTSNYFKFKLNSAEFASRNAGEGVDVVVDGTVLNQGRRSNLVVPATLEANISRANLTITSSDVSKTYDGLFDANGTALVAAGTSLKGKDSISGGTFAYVDKNAGTGKTVTVAGVTVDDGNDGNNYNVTYIDNTTSKIDKASLTLSAVSDSKTFDASTTSSAAPQVSGLVAGEAIGGLSQSFDSSTAGTRVINVNDGFTITDSKGVSSLGNYEVTLVSAAGAIAVPPVTSPTTTPPPDLSTVINNGGSQPSAINVDLAGLGDLLAQLPPTAAGEDDDPEKIKARRRSDRSPLRVTDGGVNAPQPSR